MSENPSKHFGLGSGSLIPTELLDAARDRSVEQFLNTYGDTLLLVVEIPEGDIELVSALSATAVRGGDGTRVRPQVGAMQFHTAHVNLPQAWTRGSVRPPSSLQARLRTGIHFAVPLRKRVGVDAAFTDRISVGRATNKDIVLRHASVSKFHAWFEIDESQTFHLADADSKNRTYVNGVALEPRALALLNPGDQLRFGSVAASLLAPRALWNALNATDED